MTAAGSDTLIAEVERLLEKALADEIPLFAARRPRRALLRAGRPLHSGADRGRLATRRAHRSHDAVGDGDCRAHHHLPLRARARHSPRSRWSRPARCSGTASFSTTVTPSNGWRRSITIVFDKTGTITLPDPRVDNAATVEPDLLEMAARLALSSHHPLAG